MAVCLIKEKIFEAATSLVQKQSSVYATDTKLFKASEQEFASRLLPLNCFECTSKDKFQSLSQISLYIKKVLIPIKFFLIYMKVDVPKLKLLKIPKRRD